MSLPRFVLPISAEEFLRDYWQKKPLLMRRAASGLDLVDGDRLAGLALEEEVESRLVQGNSPENLQLTHGPFTEGMFQQLAETNWTLLVQSVDHYLTEVSLLLDSFQFLPAWRLEDIMISYAAEGGGVGPHHDPYDVFLIQANGTREWRLGQSCDENTPLLPHDSLKLLKDFRQQESLLLEPGDVLYLPPGLAHWGIARSGDCITWSVGFRTPDMFELLDQLLAESEELRKPFLFTDPVRTSSTQALSDTDLHALLEQTQSALKQLPLRSLLTRWLSLPRQETLELLDVDAEVLHALAPEAALARHGGARLLLEDEAACRVWINGDMFEIDADARPAVQRLARQRLFTRQELKALTRAPAFRRLLDTWIECGYFQSL